MSIIKVENLTFSYQSSYHNIFENVSFTIDTDWRLGFVGRNGRGKTTFLRLLTGEYEYSGRITASVKFDYFPYRVSDEGLLTIDVLREKSPLAEEWEFLRELSYLEVDGGVLYRPFNTLSHGERTKALLAALFVNDGRFLLIDEPTNHLDGRARERVAQYLKRKKGFILVSHDRSVLDSCVDHILSINRNDIEVVSGNFSSFTADFERRQESERKENERLKADIRRLSETARRTEAWADRVEQSKIGAGDKGYVGHMSAKMMKRAKVVEARVEKEIEQKSSLLKNSEYAGKLKMFPVAFRAETVAELNDAAACYDGREIMRPVSFTVKRGERIALDGKNGCGKSSILKLLTGEQIAHSGRVSLPSGLKVSYIPQDASRLCGTLKDYAAENGVDESLLKTVLSRMGCEKAQFEKDISDFSDGQKKKTLIAKSLCEHAHLYVWDEPLNFIDVYSRMQIEAVLCEFDPTMIFVEHDRAFRQKIATRVIELC